MNSLCSVRAIALIAISLLLLAPISQADSVEGRKAPSIDDKSTAEVEAEENEKFHGSSNAASLIGIQSKIQKAEFLAFQEKDFSYFEELERYISSFDEENSEALSYHKNYWIAFLNYKKAISMMRAGENESAEPPLKEAIKVLKSMENKTVETDALLGMAAGLNLQYVPQQNIFSEVNLVNDSIEKALRREPENIRALYAKAVADFNTPREFGGGQEAENVLKKVFKTSVPRDSSLSPTWGYDLCLALQIAIHREKDRHKKAKQLLKTSIAKYPESVAVLELQSTVDS